MTPRCSVACHRLVFMIDVPASKAEMSNMIDLDSWHELPKTRRGIAMPWPDVISGMCSRQLGSSRTVNVDRSLKPEMRHYVGIKNRSSCTVEIDLWSQANNTQASAVASSDLCFFLDFFSSPSLLFFFFFSFTSPFSDGAS
jgi:hypothetical protein